jgi:hypothetical protein
MRFFSAETTNTDSETVAIGSYGQRKYDIFTIYAWGTWGGATMKLQISLDQSQWFDVSGASFTDDGALNVQFRAPYARMNISGGSGASLNAEMR